MYCSEKGDLRLTPASYCSYCALPYSNGGKSVAGDPYSNGLLLHVGLAVPLSVSSLLLPPPAPDLPGRKSSFFFASALTGFCVLGAYSTLIGRWGAIPSPRNPPPLHRRPLHILVSPANAGSVPSYLAVLWPLVFYCHIFCPLSWSIRRTRRFCTRSIFCGIFWRFETRHPLALNCCPFDLLCVHVGHKLGF